MKRWLAPIFVVGTFAQGQTSPDSFKYRVAVALEIDDATVKDRAISVIDRELRALGDVVVVDEKPRYKIDIVGVQTQSQSGLPTGYAFAVAFYRSYNLVPVQGVLKASKPASSSGADYLKWADGMSELWDAPSKANLAISLSIYTGRCAGIL
jgi:hypothetical protein